MAATAQKFVAVFLVCMVVLMSAMDVVPKAEAVAAPPTGDVYRRCFDRCLTPCMNTRRGYTDCEMKCDTECVAKEYNAKLRNLKV